MTCIYDYYSDVGGRENNEDAALALGDRGRYLFAVCDGLGGHECGEVASAMAVEELKRQFEDGNTPFDPVRAISDANLKILKKQREDGKKMKTTVALAYINGNVTTVAHVGDSRVYLFCGNRIVFQTVDHSASQLAVASGEIQPSQIRHHEDRNILTRALGANENMKSEKVEMPTNMIDALLISSDGFWEYVYEEDMLTQLERSEQPSKWLSGMREIHDRSVPPRHDNHTAVVAFVK